MDRPYRPKASPLGGLVQSYFGPYFYAAYVLVVVLPRRPLSLRSFKRMERTKFIVYESEQRPYIHVSFMSKYVHEVPI